MAESVLRAILHTKGVSSKSVHIESAGTHPYQVGNPPFALAVETASKRGYSVGERGARCVRPIDFDTFDHILAMDRSNLLHLQTICPTRCKQKLELLLEYGDKYHGKDVRDPYGGPLQAYELALDMIEDGCRGLALVLSRAASA